MCIKEYENGAHIQRKKTILLEFRKSFDSHPRPDRMAQFIIAQGPAQTVIGTTSILITALSKATNGTSNIIKLPFKATPLGTRNEVEYFIKVYVKLYEESAPLTQSISGHDTSVNATDPMERGQRTELKRHRGAIKNQDAEYHHLGHAFQRHYFRQPTYCGHCQEFVWGLTSKQGFLCKYCSMACHNGCIEKIFTPCQNSTVAATSANPGSVAINKSFNINIRHKFKITTLKWPTHCRHCGQFIFGLFKQGAVCKECGFTVHKKCIDQVANTCGTNMREISVALAELENKNLLPKTQGDPKVGSSGDTIVPLPTFDDEDEDNIYLPPSEYAEYTPKAPKPPVRQTTIVKRNKLKVLMKIDNFSYTVVLGKGSFGKVLLARIEGCDGVVAVKAMQKHTVMTNGDVLSTAVEKRMLELAGEHPYLAHLVATLQDDAYLYFVMEYLSGGDLMHWIQKKRVFTREVSTFYAAEIYSGLKFLHKRKIVYRDLKLDNVLLDNEGHCRIADFGMCRENVSENNKCHTFCGTPEYLAPEIIRRDLYTFSVDWWSYGVLVYEMLTGNSPFHGDPVENLYESIQNDDVPYPRKMDPDARDLCKGLFERRPERRLGVKSDLKKHAFFKSIDFDRLENKQIAPPFRPPTISNFNDPSTVDQEFKDLSARVSTVSRDKIEDIDQKVFTNFDTINPRAHEIIRVH